MIKAIMKLLSAKKPNTDHTSTEILKRQQDPISRGILKKRKQTKVQ